MWFTTTCDPITVRHCHWATLSHLHVLDKLRLHGWAGSITDTCGSFHQPLNYRGSGINHHGSCQDYPSTHHRAPLVLTSAV
ncbi:hypothetical protein NXS19_013975 [Fusarium pseudograminearum]|nr:hypothetical protein NXS19_013975 [Fusarium pseudograminearum]